MHFSYSPLKAMQGCLRDDGVVNEDKISHLPEDLIVDILSLLPTKDVVVTASVLSKRWRSLWKFVPKLEFDCFKNKSVHETFSKIVGRVLLSHKAPVLESLHFNVNSDHCNARDMEMWIRISYARHLRELVFDVYSGKGSFTLPSSFYNCDTLETLILGAWVLIDVPSRVCLKSLRTLHLDKVDYKADASVFNLLSGCPNLENLVMDRFKQDVKIFTISVASLQRLTIHDDYTEDIGSYVINAPSLKYLEIQGIGAPKLCLIENAPELVEANISASITIDAKLLGSLTSIKRLSLTSSPSKIAFFTGSIFYRLVYLELATYKAEWWNVLLLMLDCSPKLQVLKLIGKDYCGKGRTACEKWNQPKNVPECLMLHLETFVWNGYKEQLKKEKEVAIYILRNAIHLKRATFSIKGLNSDERHEMLEELESVIRASNSSCKLLLSE